MTAITRSLLVLKERYEACPDCRGSGTMHTTTQSCLRCAGYGAACRRCGGVPLGLCGCRQAKGEPTK